MIQVILATHAGLGKAMLETAAIISGGTEGAKTIGLYPGDGLDGVENELRGIISKLGKGDSVLCLTDIPGGSLARVAATLALECPDFHVVSGVNLGMATEALLLRDCMEIEQLKGHIITSAVNSIIDVSGSYCAALSEALGSEV